TVDLQGTPSTAGASQTVAIKVTDAKGLTNTITSTINIVAPSCSSNCTISGNVSGPTASGVTIALSGPTSAPNATTDSSGNYSFTGLAGGTYTLTPSLSGYIFTPNPASVTTTGATTTQNFVETSAVTSYSISGTLTYAGSKNGRTFIRVYPANGCSGQGCAVAGTSLAAAPTSGGTAYTVRGLQPGGYVVLAEVDSLNNGAPNASNPNGSSSTVNISSANATGADITLTDPATPTPVAISDLSVAPGNGIGLLQYNQNGGGGSLQDSNGREIATSYEVDYDTNSSFTSPAPTVLTFAAHGTSDRTYIIHSLAPGTYYFRMYALVGATKSAASPTASAAIRGTDSGANMVSGSVSFPVTATGPLFVGLYNGTTIYSETIASPVSPQAYSFSGVPSGNYQAFAILDQNNNGQIDVGDVSNINNSQGGPPPLTVSGNTANDIALTADPSTIIVTTGHQQTNGANDSYNLNLGITWGTKRPVAMTMFSGPNVIVPWDMSVDSNNTVYINLNNTPPQVGDTYKFQVTFSDGTIQTLTGSVTAVLSSFAQNLSVNSPVAGSATVPVFNWTAPSTPPASYTYNVNINNHQGTSQENWSYYGSRGNGIPSSQTNVTFNTDGSANPSSSLTVGGTYDWSVTVQDANGNSAQETASPYVVP
ncbi:MAG: hypothetical protein ACRD4Y_02275, partial [Candidatus Acidiferrales bacterium]